MKGWVTWVGIALVIGGAALKAIDPEMSEMFTNAGMGVIALGLGRKIEKKSAP